MTPVVRRAGLLFLGFCVPVPPHLNLGVMVKLHKITGLWLSVKAFRVCRAAQVCSSRNYRAE